MIFSRIHLIIMSFLFTCSVFTHAEMKVLDDVHLDAINGQGGVYLTGEFILNRDGGPLWSNQAGQLDSEGGTKVVRDCGAQECGLRVAILVDKNVGGWFVLDDVSGGFAFEGLTLRTEYIEKDEEDGDFNKTVLKLGLPDKVKMTNYKYTIAASNGGQWSDDVNYKQTDMFGVQQHGEVTLKGNLLMFPVD
jgi:hypothetical protein